MSGVRSEGTSEERAVPAGTDPSRSTSMSLAAAVVVPAHGGQRLGAVRVVCGVVLDERAVVQPGFEVLRPGALVAPAAGLMGSHARASLEWVRPPAGAGDQ